MTVIWGTSTQQDGSMGLVRDIVNRQADRNRRKFLEKLGIPPDRLVRPQQVHGSRIAMIRTFPPRGRVSRADGLITARAGIFLSIASADCFPVFFSSADNGVVGIVHAGWRGVIKGIVPNMVRVFRTRYGVGSDRIKVVVGPGIRKCHYEVWPKTRHKGIVKVYRRFLSKRGNRLYADLESAIKYQLRRSGVLSKNIRAVGECTYHMPRKYFSLRRDASVKNPRGFGNMISVIGIKT